MKTYPLTLLAGVLLGLAFPSWHWWPLAWVALAPLLFRAMKDSPSASARHFFLAGFVFHVIVLQWLLSNVYWAGGWAAWGYILICVYMALYWALLGAVLAWVAPRLPSMLIPLACGVLWAAMEFAQARLFTGFGWTALGYTQGRDPWFLQLAALGSVNLLGFVMASVNAFVAHALAHPTHRVRHAIAAVAIVGIAHGAGAMLLRDAQYPSTPFRVGIIQSDFPLEMKWDGEYTYEMVRNAAAKSRTLASGKPVDLFVWPESLVMDPIETPEIFAEITALTRDTGTPLYTGSMKLDGGEDFNSSHLVLADGTIAGEYEKAHLVPFGEYVPLSGVLPIGKIVPAIGNVAAGNAVKVLSFDDVSFGPLICFEVLFPEMSEKLREKGAAMLVVITNLGWFGRSNAIPEELEIARMRAVETRLPLVHAANTGISGVFDPWGRFAPIRGWFDADGTLYRVAPNVALEATVMERMGDSLEIAAPGRRPIPYGPVVFPWIMTLMSVVVLGAGLVRKPHIPSSTLFRPRP